jgi:spermidine/putrescine transport system ATP-binding protein
MTAGSLGARGLCKSFGPHPVLTDLDLEVPAGSFTAILGPSGSGKTTLLRVLAGLERADGGSVMIGDTVVDGGREFVPAERRRLGYVSQEGSLFPHLNVEANVGFGLARRDRRGERVRELLDAVGLSELGRRYPHQLSGGQQQRVALARALVLKPAVLLLDEPLGALDAKLRRALQVELKALQERVGITFLYVTHDQEEALTMSDRLAVMSNGRIAQLGSPREVYEEPADAYVADFLGVSNLMEATVVAAAAGPAPCRLKIGEFELSAECGRIDATGDVKLAIRPERVQLKPYEDSGPNRVPGMVERVVFLGSATQVFIRLAPGEALQALVHNDGEPVAFQQGSAVNVLLPADALRVLPAGGASVAEIHEETLGDQPQDLAVATSGSHLIRPA